MEIVHPALLYRNHPFPHSPSDPEKDRALVWWAAFGPRCLTQAKYNGYEPPLLSSLEAGLLGGIIVVAPTTLATVSLIALLGGPKLQRALSCHITFLLGLASAIAVSTATRSVGVTIVQCTRPDNYPPLDATHAARAGALGACILTVPTVSTASFLMCKAQTMPSTRNEPSTPPEDLVRAYLVGVTRPYGSTWVPVFFSLGLTARDVPRTELHQILLGFGLVVLVHMAAETAAYVVVILCYFVSDICCVWNSMGSYASHPRGSCISNRGTRIGWKKCLSLPAANLI